MTWLTVTHQCPITRLWEIVWENNPDYIRIYEGTLEKTNLLLFLNNLGNFYKYF